MLYGPFQLWTLALSTNSNYCYKLVDESSAVSICRINATCGLVSFAIFQSVASLLLLQVLLKALSQEMEFCNYSFDYYAIFWGMSAVLCMLHKVLLNIKLLSRLTFNPEMQQRKYVRLVAICPCFLYDILWPFTLVSS